MKKIIMAMLLGVLIIGCGKEMNWYKAPYAKETIMAEGEVNDAKITEDHPAFGGMLLYRNFMTQTESEQDVFYSYCRRSMGNGAILQITTTNNFKFDKLNEILKEFDYVVVPFTEQEYNEELNTDYQFKNDPRLKDETDFFMFALVPKKYIK